MKVWPLLKRTGFAACLIGGGLWIGSMITSNADGLSGNIQPGSANDPVVTKSYVDEAIRQALGGGTPPVNPGGGSNQPVDPGPGKQTNDELKIVQLEKGYLLLAAEKGTELIVRNGKTLGVSDTVDGLADVTDGKDVKNGNVVSNNHLLIAPAAGRGVKPDASVKGTIYVMVRGAYDLVIE